MTLSKQLDWLSQALSRERPVGLPYVRGTSPEILQWFKPFADTVLAHSAEFSSSTVVFLTVCSYAKPYSHSFIHYGINQHLHGAALLGLLERWHLSSAGVVPSALEGHYPFCAYDWDNAEASEEELTGLRERIAESFTRWLVQYVIPFNKTVVVYFREDSNTMKAIREAMKLPESDSARLRSVVVGDWTNLKVAETVCLGRRYTDPDAVLLDPANLMKLVDTLRHLL